MLFLLEGPSDETALIGPMRSLIASRTGEKGPKAESEEFHTDVTTVHLFRENADFTVYEDVRETVRHFIMDRVGLRHEYDLGDIARIVHIVDLDGTFIPDANVRQGDVPGYVYTLDHIEAPNVEKALERNHEKAAALNRLASAHSLTLARRKVPYSLYFMSRNLEHVLFNITQDVSNEDKRKLSNGFARKYRDDPDGFERIFMRDDVRTPGDTPRETWAFVRSGINSLRRGSNFHMLLGELGAPSEGTEG